MRPREISFVLEKQEEGPYWDRLLETKVKQPWLRVDFKNWKDEDDDEEEGGAQGQDLGRFITLYLFATFLKYFYVSKQSLKRSNMQGVPKKMEIIEDYLKIVVFNFP